MKNCFKLFGLLAFIGLLITGCPLNEEANWYEGTWNHQAGRYQLIIDGSAWTLKDNGNYDEKGTIAFNEPAHRFTMTSTHTYDKNGKVWDAWNDLDQKTYEVTGRYTVDGNKWTVSGIKWDGFDGIWTKR
jgi:hypothetical protein